MKIVYFDYWTVGINNFIGIDKELKKLGHETILLHIGSFRSKCEKSEIIKNIKCNDISYYNTKYIYRMLSIEKPDIIISLNSTYILDRALILTARKLKIKTVFIMHGSRTFGDDTDKFIKEIEKSYNGLVPKIKKASKYASTVIPNYLYAMFKYDKKYFFSFKYIIVLYSYFKNPGRSFYYPSYCEELIHDKCLVYSNNEIDYYNKICYKKEDIFVVGNPKYDDLFINYNNKFEVKDRLPLFMKNFFDKKQEYILYLEESLPESGNLAGVDINYRNQYIDKLAKRLEKDNLALIVKLHPTVKIDNFEITSKNVFLVQSNLDEYIFFAKACIAHISTTINNCVILNKPVLHTFWGKHKNLPTFFVDAGVSNLWRDIDDEINYSINTKKREIYSKKYITIAEPVAMKNIIKEIIE